MSIETPPHIVPPPDDSEYHASGWKLLNCNDGLYNMDDNLLRDIRDYTSHIDLNNSDHTIEIAQPIGAELAEILTRLRELTSRDLGIGSSGVAPADEHTSDGQQPADNNPSPSPEAGTTGAEEYVLERRQLHQIKQLQPPLKRQDLVAWK